MRAPPELDGAELWSSALELEPSGVAVLAGPELRVRVVNAAFRAAIPTAHRDPTGRLVEEVWPGEAGLRIREIASRVLASGEPALHERFARYTEGGVERAFQFHVKPLPGGGGPALLVVVWDTSDVEEARRAAERARQRAELLAATAGELGAGVDLDVVARTALVRATSLLGAADGALWLAEGGDRLQGFLEVRPLGRKGEWLDLAEHPHSLRAARALVPVLFARGEAEGVERAWMERTEAAGLLVAPLAEDGRCAGLLQLVYREGGPWPRPEDVDFAEAIAGQCSLAVARARAFDAERRARARAEAAEAEARRVGELQERLAAVVGHDLRTPLAVIRLTVEALARRAADAAAARGLARVAASAARMEAIIRDLLDFSRARAGGGIPVRASPVRLDEVAREAVAELEAATARAVRLEVSGDCGLHGDPSRLGQIVSNLVANALQHGAPEEEVLVSVAGEGSEVVLRVHNAGPPIPPAVLATLFEPFRRGGSPRGDGRSGHLGLGLFIVAELARAHGGAASARSDGTEGTTFEVRLPRSGSPAR
jgi:signal transduction histidine kinase